MPAEYQQAFTAEEGAESYPAADLERQVMHLRYRVRGRTV